MDKLGALPLHMQITELIIRDIAAGRLVDGERLAPERDMAESFGIAVSTLRKALASLQEKGLLERVQGSGNYIRTKADTGSVYAFLRLELVEGGGLPQARALEVEFLPKNPALPYFGPHTHGHRIRRLPFLSRTIAAAEGIWLAASYGVRPSAVELSESLYYFYARNLNLRIARAEDRVGLGPLPDWVPPDFPHAAGTQLPMVTRVSYGYENAPVEASWTWYDPDRVRYTVRLK